MSPIGKALMLVLTLASPALFAATTWTVTSFDDGTNSSTLFAQDADAYSTTGGSGGSTGTLAVAALCSYSGEYGVVNYVESNSLSCNASAPNHSTDNSGPTDMILLKFQSAVTLSQFTIGWNGSDNMDVSNQSGTQPAGSDVSILAYTGGAASAPLLGLTAAGLLSNGWTAIGNYANVGVGSNTQSINTSTSSSWWLVSAYNTAFSVSGAEMVGTLTGPTSSSTKDYFKLVSVAGSVVPPPPGVPEPGSLALVALALTGALGFRRKQIPR